MKRARRNFWISSVIILIFLAALGYLAAGFFSVPGLTMENYKPILLDVVQHPLRNYYNEKTPYFLGAIGFGWLLYIAYGSANLHNLRPGEEYGTARWANVKTINKRLASMSACYFLFFKYKKPNQNNRILSEHVRISYDGRKTLLNNNMLIVGGSGSGKTAFFVTPNLLQDFGSNVYTDPKGTLMEDFGNYLDSKGRRVLGLNLCEMEKSCQYNPFRYIRKSSDVSKLITNLIANTTPGDTNPHDPFWEKAERMYLTAIFSYVWLECPKIETIVHENGERETITMGRTFRTVLRLLDEAVVTDDPDAPSRLDIRMNRLAREKGENHQAVKSYRRCTRGAGDTIRSIIISANVRFDPFDDPELLRILDDDDIDIPSLGVGVNGDRETKTSLFCCIPDDDDTYNFVIGMLYTQIFQELYRQARIFGGELPIDVGFWFDEFANIKMPNSFEKILATCRSRKIYCVILLQSLAQIKGLYKDSKWEGIVGNCDTFVYLGGNEASSHKYVSEQLDKATIEKRSSGESKGSCSSSSQNYDVLGRELLTPGEIAKLGNRCICIIRGEDPIMDRKWNYFRKKIRKQVASLGKFQQPVSSANRGAFSMLKPQSLEYYKECKKNGENVEIYRMDMETFLAYDFESEVKAASGLEIKALLQEAENSENRPEPPEEKGAKSERQKWQLKSRKKEDIKEVLADILIEGDFDSAQISVLQSAISSGLDYEQLLKLANPEIAAEKMKVVYELMVGEKEREE